MMIISGGQSTLGSTVFFVRGRELRKIFRSETSKSYNNMDLPQKTYLGQRLDHNRCCSFLSLN